MVRTLILPKSIGYVFVPFGIFEEELTIGLGCNEVGVTTALLALMFNELFNILYGVLC